MSQGYIFIKITPIRPKTLQTTVPAEVMITVEILELDFWICCARLSTLDSTISKRFSNKV
jgi:hypothetical protein